ncbi:MAG: PIN domain-containing protein [Candidatus Thiosymbion ectosymbiont of Robbea hypermnestra]|nr:PIN domain-containing protein [Candidatus Thiosymbion ectosymbiont of Robbea hypermnestra]
MRSIVVDSGPLIALFDASDEYHGRAVQFVRNLSDGLVTNLPVITEVIYMLDFSAQAQRDFLYWSEGAMVIDTKTRGDFPRIRAILDKYGDLPADFADASLVALCERLKTTAIASVDRDFTIYRTRDRNPFRNLFFEH